MSISISNKHNFGNSQSGQIGLIIILIMIVILTIGLSVVSRSTQDLSLTTQNETSTRVFNAAESEMESALSAIYQYEFQDQELPTTSPETDLDGIKSKFSIELSNSLETRLAQGAVAELKLNDDPSGNINIRWSRENCNNNPASLLISVYAQDPSDNFLSRYYGVTINDCNNERDDNLEQATGAVSTPYSGSFVLPVSTTDKVVRIMPLYNSTDIFIPSNALISEAQYNVTSQAQSIAENKETNAINVKRSMPGAPNFMDFTLVSGATINK